MWDGELVTQCMPQRTGTSPNKRHQIMTPEVLESGSKDARVQKMPKESWKQALWKIAYALEQLVEAVGNLGGDVEDSGVF